MKTLSDLIVRRFTKELENNPGKTVYDLFEWKTVDVNQRSYQRKSNLRHEGVGISCSLFSECLRYHSGPLFQKGRRAQ